MKTMHKILLTLALGLVVVGCGKQGMPTSVEGAQDDFHVSKLFVKDSCTVYRFHDYGDVHYFTDCGTTISSKTESCGKNCVHTFDEEIGAGDAQ